MEFRAKSPDQVLDQLDCLSRKYGVFSFNAIDNIMAPEYAEKVFRRLAEANTDLDIHYEIRPNFSRMQLGRMRTGGLCSVQPGVESLATNILKSMRKMTTGMRNVELIKWCTYYGIHCMYNILMRFPGETEEDYRMQAALLPRILHLQPPWGIVKARADRGSPMLPIRRANLSGGLSRRSVTTTFFPNASISSGFLIISTTIWGTWWTRSTTTTCSTVWPDGNNSGPKPAIPFCTIARLFRAS
jgi:hypothetical protein